MVGRATTPKLNQIGIYTIGQLAKADPEIIKYKFKSWGTLIQNYANGIEESLVQNGGRPPMKGIGNSTTISYDIDNRAEAYKVLLSLTETVCMRLRQAKYCARLVSVSLKTNEFMHYSHQHKFCTPTDCTTSVYEVSRKLFDELWMGQSIILLLNSSFLLHSDILKSINGIIYRRCRSL